jgi:hypothetical protein
VPVPPCGSVQAVVSVALVTKASDVEYAVKEAVRLQPSLIILDVLSGVPICPDLSRAFKGNKATEHIPMIALVFPEEIEEATEAGIEYVDNVALDTDALLKKVMKHLR